MKRIFAILIGVGVLALFVWTMLFLYRKSQAVAVPVEIETPFVADIVNKTVATGAIVPRKEIEIKPRVSGIVETLAVEPGKTVKAGDLIAKIRIIPDMVTLNRAEASVKTARINVDGARRELARNEQLMKDKIISETELNRLQLDYDLKREELAAAENNLSLVKEGASRRSGKVSNVVTSTVAGMVLDVPVKEGASVIESNTFNAGTTIATIADMGDMVFQGMVDESEVGKIQNGMKLQIRVGAIDDEVYEATLEYISPKGVKQEGAIQFEIKAAMTPREGAMIRAGYSANADIVLARREQVQAIRESVVTFEGDKAFVEVEVAPQRFERREIQVGLSDGINIEVESGLDANARLKRPTAPE
jgi:HlyD family secretion protein